MWAKGLVLKRILIFMACLAVHIKELLTTEDRFRLDGYYHELASVWANYYGERHLRRELFEHVIVEAKQMVSHDRTNSTLLPCMTHNRSSKIRRKMKVL